MSVNRYKYDTYLVCYTIYIIQQQSLILLVYHINNMNLARLYLKDGLKYILKIPTI